MQALENAGLAFDGIGLGRRQRLHYAECETCRTHAAAGQRQAAKLFPVERATVTVLEMVLDANQLARDDA